MSNGGANKLGIRQSYLKKPRASDELAQRSPDKNTQGINKLEDYRSLCGERQNRLAVSLIGSCGARPTCLSHIFFLRYLSFFSPPSLPFNTLFPFTSTMADNRSDSEGGARAKRQKMDAGDPKNNPYLAHMYENNNASDNSALAKFKRHQTTAALAKKAEDGDINPFTGRPFSSKYFSILKTRRDLPVHTQR